MNRCLRVIGINRHNILSANHIPKKLQLRILTYNATYFTINFFSEALGIKQPLTAAHRNKNKKIAENALQ